jgi:hypothetical protein
LSTSQWILDRGDGNPTANVVIISFLDPVALLHQQSDSNFNKGVPRGITQNVVSFFSSSSINVLLSIGGAAYTPNWDQALSDPTTLAKNAAVVAKEFGVGIEIDYENENQQSLSALDTFVKTYRSLIPYQHDGPAESLLTVDMGAGTGYLTSVSKMAVQWINESLINWGNAMVGASPYDDPSEPEMYWQQHLQGANWDNLPGMKPDTLVGSLYASSQSKNCKNWDGTVLQGVIPWVEQQLMRGIFFWAAGCPSSECVSNCTGIETGSKTFLG